MNRSEHSRRTLLKVALSTLCSSASLTLANTLEAADTASSGSTGLTGSLYISGARQSAEQYVAVVFDEHGTILSTVPLSARAHGAAAHQQTHRACLFARRPGMYMNTFDIRAPQTHQIVTPAPGRHFYGHGIFSESGDLLYVTENDFDGVRGVIGVYDASDNYQRIGEMASAGLGPHDIIRVPGSPLLVVANGGIQTHPDTGREKLNIESMKPCLSIIDSRTGEVVGQHFLPDGLHQVSIRHLACTLNGEVWFAGQYEGIDPLVNGLAGVISVNQSINSFQHGSSHKGLSLIDLPTSLQANTLRYLSSVAIAGSHVIYTAAKGGLAFKINRMTRQVEDSVSIFDCSGVAPLAESLPLTSGKKTSSEAAMITAGTGEIVRLDEGGTTTLASHSLQWDNHVYQLI